MLLFYNKGHSNENQFINKQNYKSLGSGCYGMPYWKYKQSGELFEEETLVYRRYEFIQSTEFIKLAVWMYSKRNDRKCTSTNNELDGYISTLKKLKGICHHI